MTNCKSRVLTVVLAFIVAFAMCGTFTITDSFASSKTPAQVKSLKAVAQSSSKAKLTWGKAKNAKKYQVYKKAPGGKYKLVKTTTKRTYISTQTPGKKYYYKVRGVNGKKKGKYSKVKSLTIKKYKNGDVVPSKYATKVGKASMKYVESEDAYVISFATFLDDGKTSVRTSGIVMAFISDDDGNLLYGPDENELEKATTLDKLYKAKGVFRFTSKNYVKQSGKTYYLCNVKIPRSNLVAGTQETGFGLFTVIFDDGRLSDFYDATLNNLPI